MTERENFLRQFNDAFVKNDINFILDSVTDSVSWNMIGDSHIKGKEAVAKAMNKMEGPSELVLKINSIITRDSSAAVDGIMEMKDKEGNIKKYGFCDVYQFSDHKEFKISEMRSYIVEIKDKDTQEGD